MYRLLLLLLFILPPAQAEEVRIPFGALTLNADLEGVSGAFPERMYLILHGTLAHKDMEIIQGLQEQLADQGKASLAPNLSLQLNDRHGFYDCATVHRHRHDDAVAELAAWARWLAGKGVKQLDLVGHSRGGNQVLLFARHKASASGLAAIASVTSIAPMVFRARPDKGVLQELENDESTRKLERFLHCSDTPVSRRSLESYWFDPAQHTPALWQGYQGAYGLVTGSEDPLTDKLAPSLKTLPAGSRHLSVEGADHFFRDLYLDEVVEWLLETRP